MNPENPNFLQPERAKEFLEDLASSVLADLHDARIIAVPFDNPVDGLSGVDISYVDESGDTACIRVPLEVGKPAENIVEIDAWEEDNHAEEILLKCFRSGWIKVPNVRPKRVAFYHEETSTAFIFGIVDIGDMRTEVLEEADVSVYDCILDPERED
jgi:hypothetical protein